MADISTPVMNTSGGELIAHVTNSAMLDTAIREQDFVTSFSRNWNSLMDIMSVTRMIRKEPGSTLKYRRAAVQLLTASGGSIDRVNFKTGEEDDDGLTLSATNPIANWHSNNTVNNASSYFTGLVDRLTEYNPQYATFGHTSNIAEGETIPYSWGTVADVYFGELNVDKYAKAVSLEAINQWGYDSAVAETDAEFLNELQNLVLSDFYAFLQKCGSETGNAAAAASEGGNTQTWQQCLALAKGKCLNAFQKMHRLFSAISFQVERAARRGLDFRRLRRDTVSRLRLYVSVVVAVSQRHALFDKHVVESGKTLFLRNLCFG